jgi:N-methylhydantoinase A/oxoprolinase/acetone carboxylase beta subunit
MRIGIDVGGTNTDAVLMNGDSVVASHKTTTTPDVSTGIIAALEHVLSTGACMPAEVSAVMIGTTHFTNAVVERKRLLEVAAVRVALPATQALPPMIDWPVELRSALGNHVFFAHGGHEFNGVEISRLDEPELRGIAAEIRERGIRSVALSSVFSPVNGAHERRAAEILIEEIPGLFVSQSGEIGRIGLLERENAAIYISQNDGTLMRSEFAERYPILTFASGPTNSMRGAAFLSGVRDCVIVDIGGTTSDVGVLVNGFPREASSEVEIAEVRTNFRMPDVISLGLGGGSIVRVTDGGLTVGPDSVGYELTTRALVFGGDVLTTTDVAVAAGLADIGDRGLVAHLDRVLVEKALAAIRSIVERGIDKLKTSADPVTVVLVGGGTILVGDRLAGASELVKPDHAPVANAIGAAIAKAGGEIDHVFSLDGTSRDAVLAEARLSALEKAVEAGARRDTVEIVDVDEIPLTYLPGNAIRFRIKAVGELEQPAIPMHG